MNNDMTDNDLQQQTTKLPREISPERDLWPGIEKAIIGQSSVAAEKTKANFHMAWAASIVVAILVSWLSLSPQQVSTPEHQSLAQTMVQDFEQQKQLMLTSLGQPDLKALSPEMKAQLVELDNAQQALKKALAKDANNGELLNLLRWTQKQELELLKKLYSPQWQTI